MKLEFRNELAEELAVVVEPWADQINLAGGKSAVLRINKVDPSAFTIVVSGGVISVFVEDQEATLYSFDAI